jgi:hypothetical protein
MRLKLLVALTALAVAAPAGAAGIFDKKPKGDPQERVLKLVRALQSDPDAGARADAAEDLREFDAATFPEIVPVLIDALQKDSSGAVRRAAAQSLGKVKPATTAAAQALEQAAKQDSSLLVRMQARSARLGYHVPEAKPAANGPLIRVPPAGPDGRLSPVPVPSASAPPAAPSLGRPLVSPRAKDGPILKPADNSPATEGPVLVGPRQ